MAGKSKGKSAGGRPTRYQAAYAEQAKVACELGATDKDLARMFGVTKQTIDRWKQAHPEFCASVKKPKSDYDAQVERSLRERATGYTDPDGKHYPPDTTAQIFWLKNRQPQRWRDKQQVEVSGEITNTMDFVLSKAKRRD